MKIEVSNGEVVDKFTILKLKQEFIKDEDKLVNINKEHDILRPIVVQMKEALDYIRGSNNFGNLCTKLYNINAKLWEIEDDLRIMEKHKQFDREFIEYARLVYITNDERSRIKKEINILTHSELTEEKSYESYE